MLAVEDSPAGRFLDGLGASMPRPRAIVVASAHFTAARASVGADSLPATVHDFNGFPEVLYQIRYPAPGDAALAEDVAMRLSAAGLGTLLLPEQGLDHGVWVPLRRMYPQADVPVIPLSVNPRGTASEHFAIGRALAPLRENGLLVIGSGGFVHNLGDLAWGDRDAPMPGWASGFASWMRDRLAAGDIDALLAWDRLAPGARQSHPTVEHLMPLFVALGAGNSLAVRQIHQSVEFGSLALDAFAIG